MSDPNKVVLIEWEDAVYQLDPQSLDELKTQLVYTVGWILREDDAVVIIASEYNAGVATSHRQATAIPRSVIRSIIQLRRKGN